MAVKNEESDCIIGEKSVFDGRFYVSGSILIEGKFEGDIKTDDQLIVGPTGKVRTDITARRVTVAGTLIGNIIAEEEVILLKTGKVLGNITTPKLTVEPGVITDGKVTITNGKSGIVNKLIEQDFGEGAEQIFSSLSKTAKRDREEETLKTKGNS
ncbi:MAG TPA: polymer-forming cytoskeletal protein [bacterium]|nr:polymer-forming cytoskeletal protein [bacterium]